MKRVVLSLAILAILALPLTVFAQTTTNTAFQVVNLNDTEDANVAIVFYDTTGAEILTMDDVIAAGSSETYIQADMTGLGSSFDGSVVVTSDQQIAAIVNQNTSNLDNTEGYNGSYTGFSEGSDTFYIPVVLGSFYGFHTEISIQNAGSDPVNVTVDYADASCTDSTITGLAVGTAVRLDNNTTCPVAQTNTSAVISAGGPVVAVVNQIGDTAPSPNLEQTYNGFAPASGGDTLYAPIALHDFYGFNSAFQVQNISGAPMDITVTYSDGISDTVASVADGASATFLQANEPHVTRWTGSAVVTNNTGGAMVGIVNQQGTTSAASYNMYSSGAPVWALPSLLYQYYGFTSAFQVQNISGGPTDITVTYDDATTASATAVPDGGVATFIQDNETGHAVNWAGSARVSAGGDVVIVVNQDVLVAGAIDYQYSYNAVPLQ
jgi:hypothetical protein